MVAPYVQDMLIRFHLHVPTETNERGNHIARSSTNVVDLFMDINEFVNRVPSQFIEQEEWNDAYRVVFRNDQARMILTYVESDLILVTCNDEASYQAELEAADAFYCQYGDLDVE